MSTSGLLIPALALAVAIPPPIPPPDADRMAIALELWRSEPIHDYYRTLALTEAAGELAHGVLGTAGVRFASRRYVDELNSIQTRLLADAKSAAPALSEQTLGCLAEPFARELDVGQLQALKDFVATKDGAAFWTVNVAVNWSRLKGCYKAALRDRSGHRLQREVERLQRR